MRRLLFLSTLFTLTFFLFPSSQAFAAGEFTKKYNINYEVAQSGQTNVTYRVDITNLTTQYYISEYDLIIPSTKIENIVAVDAKGSITPQVSREEGRTMIHLVFNAKAVGKGSILSFALTYQDPEIAQKKGRIWEINLPPKTKGTEITEYSAHLVVPVSFGRPTYLFPQPAADLTWNADQLEGGVVVAFGDYQLFDFNLMYHLANPKLFPVYTEIALPFDNAYQRVRFDELDPEPVGVRQDKDGNWMARYDLSPNEELDIRVSGFVKLLPFPDLNFAGRSDAAAEHLAQQKFWEVEDTEIRKLARELETPRAIYNYVVSTLNYDYQKAKTGGKRLGAKETLENQQDAICMEFADLFIALARAAGIPAREVDGFAYTTNSKLRPLSLEKDILHAWAEYWNSEKGVWVMVDPTWGTTTGGVDYFSKLDFNHFALVTRGISSEFPIPAGGYKLGDVEEKDVSVEFSLEEWQESNPQYEVFWDLKNWTFTGFGFGGSVEIKNAGSSAVYTKRLELGSTPPNLLTNNPITLSLVPGEAQIIDLQFKKTGWFENFNGTIFLTIEGETFSKPFEMRSSGWTAVFTLLALSTSSAVVFFLVQFLRRRRK